LHGSKTRVLYRCITPGLKNKPLIWIDIPTDGKFSTGIFNPDHYELSYKDRRKMLRDLRKYLDESHQHSPALGMVDCERS